MRIGEWTPGQLVVRALVVAGALVALLSSAAAGSAPPFRWVVLVAVAAAILAVSPDSWLSGSVALGTVLLWWGFGVEDPLHPAALVAAAGVLLTQVAATLAAYGPDGLPVDPRLALLWVRRGSLVFVAAPATWWVARAAEGQPEPPGLWVTAVLVVAVATFATSWVITEHAPVPTS